ncbi:MAG: hypothetical protein J6Y89_01585 [Lachnospiraceae bacterium]|nr:hypothetical protein [Lachnospiraceae bacterium]
MGIMAVLGSLFGCKKTEGSGTDAGNDGNSVQVVDLAEVDFIPGYNDMAGESHQNYLRYKDGEWTIRSIDRTPDSREEVTTTYAVDTAAVAEFEAFINENGICGLADRKENDNFITDYTPWSFTIVFGKVGQRKTYRFGEYQDYSDKDLELIKELKKRFEGLKVIPKSNKWNSFIQASDMFSEDFMESGRGTQEAKKRKTL